MSFKEIILSNFIFTRGMKEEREIFSSCLNVHFPFYRSCILCKELLLVYYVGGDEGNGWFCR